MDVSDIIEYNAAILSPDLSRSFFCLSKTDPTVGFPFDATRLIGHVFPEATHSPLGKPFMVGPEKVFRPELAPMQSVLMLHRCHLIRPSILELTSSKPPCSLPP